MFNRVRAHPLWPVRRAAWALLAVGGVPTLIGGLAVGACLYEMSSGRTDPFALLAASMAVVFLLIPGLVHLVFAVFVWRARARLIRGATIYTWVLLGLFALTALSHISWLVGGSPGNSGIVLGLSIDGVALLAMVAVLWCLRAASRCLETQAGHGFEVILPNAQALQTGYPPTTPPPARRP